VTVLAPFNQTAWQLVYALAGKLNDPVLAAEAAAQAEGIASGAVAPANSMEKN
jgi:hypothetical protein